MQYADIIPVTTEDYAGITEVWEASVRATHHFLKEEDILFFRQMIPQYLQHVEAFCLKDTTGRIRGFIGIADRNIEMLFILPSERGKGLGRYFLQFAFDRFDADKVDVNEQNEQAVCFYEKLGFVTVSREELDGSGKPYPILHMELAQ